ncbi:MAG: formimidoylglutamate deiminase [Candidatus Dormibacteria bacterium]
MRLFLLELAWTAQGLERRVLLQESDGKIQGLTPLGDRPAPQGAAVCSGLTIPGLANGHSHCFHRALRGRTEDSRAPDFWGWRDQMYELAGRLTPERFHRLARAVFGEMALAGITAVGEFHYLHHDQRGEAYPNQEMEAALISAADEAGIRLTLLDTCYLRSGFAGGSLDGAAARFSDGDPMAWARRVERLPEGPTLKVGAAAHSVRALDESALRIVASWARERDAPLHLHLSEQLAENEACLRATGRTPTALVARLGVLGPTTTAVHAIHLTEEDIDSLGRSGTGVCVCPTTERDLADGVCPARALADAGSPLSLGTDSNSVVDLFEEARAVELDQRLLTHRRGLHSAPELLQAATAGGARALGWDAGVLEVGRLADFVTLDVESPRLAGAGEDDLVSRVVYAAAPADVRRVVVGGHTVVKEGRHIRLGAVGSLLAQAISEMASR